MFPIIVLLAEFALLAAAWWFLGIAGAAVMVFSILATIAFFYNAAKNKQQMSIVKEGTIEFVVAGETLLNVLENVRDWHYKEGKGYLPYLDENKVEHFEKVKDAIVPDLKDPTKAQEVINGPSRKSLIEEKLGFFWVSALYPLRKIFKFPIVHLRLKPETSVSQDAKITDWLDSTIKDSDGKVIPGDTTMETSLLWKFPRPVLVRDVEFKDLFKANILVRCSYQMVMPRYLVFEWRERFFPLLEQAIQGAVIDYCRNYTGGYTKFIKSGSTGSQSRFFWDALEKLNHGARGLIQEFGVYLRDAVVVQIELAEQDQRTKDAIKANELARLEGQAKVTKATADAQAIGIVATAEANALTSQINASQHMPEALLARYQVDIARLQVEKADKIKSGVVWVEGGGNASIVIPTTPPAPNP